MALDATRLGNAMADAVLSVSGLTPNVSDEQELRDLMVGLAGAIVSEIITHAVVNVTTSGSTEVGPPGGPLPILNQPGTGGVS